MPYFIPALVRAIPVTMTNYPSIFVGKTYFPTAFHGGLPLEQKVASFPPYPATNNELPSLTVVFHDLSIENIAGFQDETQTEILFVTFWTGMNFLFAIGAVAPVCGEASKG